MQDVEELFNTVLSRETLTRLNLLLAVRKVVNVLSTRVLLALLSDGRGDVLGVLLLLFFFLLSGFLLFFFLRVVGVSTVKASGSACVGE